jgi:hypothetical protein
MNTRAPKNLDILFDLDDAVEALSNAGSSLRQNGLLEESRRAFELADVVRELQVQVRQERGVI